MAHPIILSPSASILDYSIKSLGSETSALMKDPAFGASIVKVASSLTVSRTDHTTIPSQDAVSWAANSRHYDKVYVMDAAHTNVTDLERRN